MTIPSGRPFHIPYAEISRTLVARDQSFGGAAPGTMGARIRHSIRGFIRSDSSASRTPNKVTR